MENLGGFVFDNKPSTFPIIHLQDFSQNGQTRKGCKFKQFYPLLGCMNQLCMWGYSCNSLFRTYGFPTLVEIAFSTEDK
jgi:hypothetical protein